MSIKEKINDEYKTALKSKDKNKISTYRLILSGIKDLDISNRSGPTKKETDDEDIKKLLKKMIKQRNESVEIYKKNKREDLLKIEQGEIDLLSTFLPKQLSEEETKKICSEIISVFLYKSPSYTITRPPNALSLGIRSQPLRSSFSASAFTNIVKLFQSEQKLKIDDVDEEIKSLRSEFVDTRTRLMTYKMESSVKNRLVEQGIKSSKTPPVKIIINVSN